MYHNNGGNFSYRQNAAAVIWRATQVIPMPIRPAGK